LGQRSVAAVGYVASERLILSMYVPKHFEENNTQWTHDFISKTGAGTVVTQGATQLHANFVPLLFDAQRNVLRGHIARANGQWSDLVGNAQALVTFTGANAYISPNWYPSKTEHQRVVPTWNYEVVHVYGAITYSHDAATLLDIIGGLTNREEAANETPWRISDAPPEYIDGLVKSIVAFEIAISRIEAKRKLCQHYSQADRWGAIAGLRERGDYQSKTIADAMESFDL
jgi:transcriptional regulator